MVDGKKTFYTNRSGKITDLPDAEPDDGERPTTRFVIEVTSSRWIAALGWNVPSE